MVPGVLMKLYLVLASVYNTAGAAAQRRGGWQRCAVEEFGAIPDDGQDDSTAISTALAHCDEVILPGPGVYDAKPMNLTSNQVLHIAYGAVLQAPTPARGQCLNSKTSCPYRVVDSFPSYTGSRDFGTPCRLGPFIGAYRARNLSITGGGVIDGAGKFFWDQASTMTIERPRLVELQFVEDLNIGPISLRQAAFWNLHPIYSQRLHIHDIRITAEGGPNTDGIGNLRQPLPALPNNSLRFFGRRLVMTVRCLSIAYTVTLHILSDPDSCKDVLIENYYYNAGDDAIAVKSGWNYAGYHMNMSSENIYARNCSSNGRGGYTIGSEMSGGVRNVSFVDSTSTCSVRSMWHGFNC